MRDQSYYTPLSPLYSYEHVIFHPHFCNIDSMRMSKIRNKSSSPEVNLSRIKLHAKIFSIVVSGAYASNINSMQSKKISLPSAGVKESQIFHLFSYKQFPDAVVSIR